MNTYKILTKNKATHVIEASQQDDINALRREGFLLHGSSIDAETSAEALTLYRYANVKKKPSKLVRWILGCLLLVVVLFGYGFGKGHADMASGKLSLFTAAITVNGMNPITAEGYKVALNSYSVFRNRVNNLSNIGK